VKHLAIIRFLYEGISFSPIAADRELFHAREWLAGPAARKIYCNTNVEYSAIEDIVKANPIRAVPH